MNHFHEKFRQNDVKFAQRDGIKIWHQFSTYLGKKLKPNFDAIPLSEIPSISRNNPQFTFKNSTASKSKHF